jgi:hypothetical protein
MMLRIGQSRGLSARKCVEGQGEIDQARRSGLDEDLSHPESRAQSKNFVVVFR